RTSNWLGVTGLACAGPAGLAGLATLRKLFGRPVYDMELVRAKVSRVAYCYELRLSIFAPQTAPQREVAARLERFAAAYRHFNLAAGNGFRPRPLRGIRGSACLPLALRPIRRLPILTTRELAGLWHLPHATADVALLERTTARRWLPLPTAVAGGCRIGVSRHQGRDVPVELPEDVLRRHLLLVAKTRRGKSTLLLRLACHAMLAQPRRMLLLVDPHQDLAAATLGLVPESRAENVVYLN